MTRWQIGVFVTAALILAGLFVEFVVPSWMFYPLGVCTGKACGYQWWSGIAGSFLLGGGIWSGIGMAYWHHQCHAPACLRLGKHPTADGTHRLCARHHPDLPDDRKSTLSEIHERHHAAKNS